MTGIDIESGLAAFFEQDHRDCDARWADVEELLDTQDVEAARSAWEKFDKGMRRHIAMEEEVMFPAFEAAAQMGGGGPTSVMRMEHKQMIGLLDQIEGAMESGDAEQALYLGDTLLMLIQQHNIKEEGMLYP
ncbi:MAG: hemerythrin domain-containing protein, partial [Lysobacterales bacterium]